MQLSKPCLHPNHRVAMATSTALPSFSHDQHHKTDAAKRKGGGASIDN